MLSVHVPAISIVQQIKREYRLKIGFADPNQWARYISRARENMKSEAKMAAIYIQ
jgi:hypothetical protein